jgi:hypothetical protein
MTIEDELLRLGELQHVGMALLQFSRTLMPGEFTKKSRAWLHDRNFVGFEIRFIRVKKLNVLVRPTRVPDEVKTILKCYAGPMSYGRIEVVSARQLAAACAYIEGSWKRRH